jgi:hypothetical protein
MTLRGGLLAFLLLFACAAAPATAGAAAVSIEYHDGSPYLSIQGGSESDAPARRAGRRLTYAARL